MNEYSKIVAGAFFSSFLVTGIFCNHITAKYPDIADVFDSDESEHYDYDLEPIVINEDVLKEFGFTQVAESSQVAMYLGEFMVEKDGGAFWWSTKFKTAHGSINGGFIKTNFYRHTKQIQYIHELQNVYHMLYGEDIKFRHD